MPRVLIVEARFYADLADTLAKGAEDRLKLNGVEVERVSVPGAFEIPATIAFALATGRYDGFVALGCVIRGETSHYEYVCAESARGLNNLAMRERAAIGYGILTVETEAQAWERAAPDKGNKGAAAAEACLAMMALKKQWEMA